mgnify:FL=1
MASIINVDQIRNAAGTSAMTINNSVKVNIPGHILQVVNAESMTRVTTTVTDLTAPTETGLNVTITPSATTSKCLIVINASLQGTGGAYVSGLIKRDSTLIPIVSGQTNAGLMGYAFNPSSMVSGRGSFSFLDSPSTTSAITYKFCITRYGGSGTGKMNSNTGNNDLSSMFVMEIAQ